MIHALSMNSVAMLCLGHVSFCVSFEYEWCVSDSCVVYICVWNMCSVSVVSV